jgi:hypothetical protein
MLQSMLEADGGYLECQESLDVGRHSVLRTPWACVVADEAMSCALTMQSLAVG